MNRYVTRDGDTIDEIVWRIYGTRAGALEAVLADNPHLAHEGVVLHAGLTVNLPDLSQAPAKPAVRLWD